MSRWWSLLTADGTISDLIILAASLCRSSLHNASTHTHIYYFVMSKHSTCRTLPQLGCIYLQTSCAQHAGKAWAQAPCRQLKAIWPFEPHPCSMRHSAIGSSANVLGNKTLLLTCQQPYIHDQYHIALHLLPNRIWHPFYFLVHLAMQDVRIGCRRTCVEFVDIHL